MQLCRTSEGRDIPETHWNLGSVGSLFSIIWKLRGEEDGEMHQRGLKQVERNQGCCVLVLPSTFR